MTSAGFLERFGTRAGFSLIKVAEIGLPVFRLLAGCLVIETTGASLVEEYILRVMALGLTEQKDISELLGLPERFVLAALADMLREGLVFERARSAEEIGRSITPLGRKLLEERKRSRPREIELNLTYDGLVHRPIFVQESALLRPRQMQTAGIPELSPLPAKGPDPGDLNVSQITAYLRESKPRAPRAAVQVLKVLRIDRKDRLFLPATALIFRSVSEEEYQVAFVIDGRLSHDHESAFRREGGVERSTVFAALKAGKENLELEKVMGAELAVRLTHASINEKRDRPVLSLKGKEERSRAEEVRSIVRQLSVLEHNPLMMKAIYSASESILIVSPWIRREVVNSDFIVAVQGALDRGVQVRVGYGISRDDSASDIDLQVRRDFDRLSAKYENFVVKRLGDTHAKILVKDREFFVVTSFNWLSFRGDPSKQFREEWGTFVESRELTEDFLKQLYPRFGLQRYAAQTD